MDRVKLKTMRASLVDYTVSQGVRSKPIARTSSDWARSCERATTSVEIGITQKFPLLEATSLSLAHSLNTHSMSKRARESEESDSSSLSDSDEPCDSKLSVFSVHKRFQPPILT